MKFLPYVISVFCAVSWAQPTLGQTDTIVDTDVCSIISAPRKFNNKLVRIRAAFMSDMHGASLVSNNCKPGGLTLWIAKGVRDNPDFKALDEAVANGNLGTAGKTIIGTFTGRFFSHAKGPHHRVLEATKVDDLDVK